MSLMSSHARAVFRPLAPEVTTIDTSLEAMQKLMGGFLGASPRRLLRVLRRGRLDDVGNVCSLGNKVATVKRLVMGAAFVTPERFEA